MINNQQKVENRRNWKGQVVDYDAIKAYEPRECLYCLTDAQVSVLAGIIEPVAWATRWQSETQPIDPAWTLEFYNDITRRLQMSCCGDNLLYRYAVDGVLESSDDGGITWTPAPQDDIRITATEFPPVPGEPSSDKKCIAATGMKVLIKSQIGDQLTDDMSRYTLDQLIKDWTSTYIGTSNPFQAILTVIVNQIFALSIALIRAALTDPVYETLQCIFLCRMSDDLSFTEAQKASVISDVGDQIGGIATLFLQQLINLLGSRGLTNLARAYGSTTGDCSDCDDCPTPCGTHWEIYPDAMPNRYGTILERGDDYLIVEATVLTGSNYYIILQTTGMDDCCYLTSHTDWPVTAPQTATGLLCGENFPVHGISDNQCIWLIQMQEGAPFTRRVTFSDCP